MVYRTRACQPCRSQRIRCDETSPECNQCTRTGRSCSGPTEGPLIVDCTYQTTFQALISQTSRRRRRLSKSRRSPTPVSASSIMDNRTDNTFHSHEDQDWDHAIHSNLIMAPSQLPIMTQNFFAKFLDCYANPSNGSPQKFWLIEMPFMTNSEVSGALEQSIQAASILFCGQITQQVNYIRGSRSIYGQALENHRNTLARLGRNMVPSAEIICTTFMLGFYESIHLADSDGYLRHVEGAARMVDLLGPEGVASGSVNKLFFTARSQMLLVSLLTKKRSLFADEAFMNIPYAGQEQPDHEKLSGIITLLIDEFNHPSPDTLIIDPEDLTPLPPPASRKITEDLKAPNEGDNSENTASNSSISIPNSKEPPTKEQPEIPPQTSHSDAAGPISQPFILSAINKKINTLWTDFEALHLTKTPIRWSPDTQSYAYPSPFIAYVTSYFDLARILSALIHIRIQERARKERDNPTHKQRSTSEGGPVEEREVNCQSPPPDRSNQKQAIRQNNLNTNFFTTHTIKQASSSILSCASYLSNQNLGCAFVRLVLPLLVVGLYGVDRSQRESAIEILEKWEDSGVVNGLAGLALRRIRETERKQDTFLI